MSALNDDMMMMMFSMTNMLHKIVRNYDITDLGN